jgi:hypothetical protein
LPKLMAVVDKQPDLARALVSRLKWHFARRCSRATSTPTMFGAKICCPTCST